MTRAEQDEAGRCSQAAVLIALPVGFALRYLIADRMPRPWCLYHSETQDSASTGMGSTAPGAGGLYLKSTVWTDLIVFPSPSFYKDLMGLAVKRAGGYYDAVA